MDFAELLSLVRSKGTSINVCSDSRRLGRGDVFVAVSGTQADGHDFIEAAIGKGAGFIVSERPVETEGARVIIVEDSKEALWQLAQVNFGEPSSKLTNLAVTGTNGKTTVCFLVRSVINKAGNKCGLIGTIVYDTCSEANHARLTTPDALEVAQISSETVKAGARFMVLEASSHALSQKRLAGINFAAAAFTNLTGDHLDYHKTEEDYLAAKMRLFEGLSEDATAILNKQSPQARQIAAGTKAKVLWYAVDEQADIVGRIESMDINGTVFSLEYAGGRETVCTKLLGEHNVSNHLAAAGLCIAAGFDLKTTAAGLSALDCVPGRLEAVECGQDFKVLVDYAHTDDALKNVLTTLRPLCTGKLTVVFGCGGDRDRSKRPRMAKVAAELADSVIVTSDNPRTESPADIIEDIVKGFGPGQCESIMIEPDRKTAIELAVKGAGKGDIVLIAGKGHETYQIIADKRIDFDDRKIARKFLKAIL
ncbi:MAG: UDP-N-acetylmuramoyl-L-alanyl-D-glutamate--2,6-diaminopimelate ligase [Planctomycetota bacterium]|jgi:UDP-N-acetylmuramoyl-L-alanyl-D-glutamate--2,6-diaminopimelate ligase